MVPDLPPLPALTRAEGELIDRYLDVVDPLGRINPARREDTYGGLRAAQALVSRATELRDTLVLMHGRGERELHAATLARHCGSWTASGVRPGSPCRPSPTVDAASGAEPKRTKRRTPYWRGRVSFFAGVKVAQGGGSGIEMRSSSAGPGLLGPSTLLLSKGCSPKRVGGE